MTGKAGLLALLVVAATVAGVVGTELERFEEARDVETELLLLPNGRHLKVASLGQASTMADLVYLWAIQFYANYNREDRGRYVEHVFSNVIPELDPHYIDPYWLGALILSLESRDLDAALRVLDKGFANNPNEWILPYLAGWECHGHGRYGQAVEYFSRAAAVPDAPPFVLRARAGMAKRGGDLREAARMWGEVLDDPRSDASSIAIAERQLRDIRVRADLQDLTGAVARFRSETGAPPRSLDELERRGYIPDVPTDPDGQPYTYDPTTGVVGSRAGLVLGEH